MKQFVPLAVVVTALSIGLYSVGQQVYRQSAYDPQVQLAHDTATKLDDGATIPSLVPTDAESQVDMSMSLARYINIYDTNGQPVAGSGIDSKAMAAVPMYCAVPTDGSTGCAKPPLANGVPTPPRGVFDAAQARGENRLTWEPRVGVRQAIVVVPFKHSTQHGYVLVGRSMSAVETRIEQLGQQVLVGWVLTMVGTLLAVWFVNRSSKKGHA